MLLYIFKPVTAFTNFHVSQLQAAGPSEAVQKSMELIGKQLQQLQLSSNKSAPKSVSDASKKKYQFWETQPVPKFGMFVYIIWVLLVNNYYK